MCTDAPVFAIPGTDYFLVTRYDLVSDISKSYDEWSSQFGNASIPVGKELGARLRALRAEMGGWVAVPTLLTAGPPAQTRYRKVIAKAFHPNAVNKFEPAVREITSRLIDSWIETGRIEFVSQFGVPLPVEVIARVLNVPDWRLGDSSGGAMTRSPGSVHRLPMISGSPQNEGSSSAGLLRRPDRAKGVRTARRSADPSTAGGIPS